MTRALPFVAAIAALAVLAAETTPTAATFTSATRNPGTVAKSGNWITADVQATNAAGGTAGRFGTYDQVVLTYDDTPSPPTSTTVTISDNGSNDTMALGGNLGSIALGADFVSGTLSFAGTVTRSNTVVTITLGAMTGLANRLRTAPAGTMQWTPGTGGGKPITESGPLDVDF